MNTITLLIICIFILPLLSGLAYPISGNRIYYGIRSALNSLKFIGAALITVHLIQGAFAEESKGLFKMLYNRFPAFQDFAMGYKYDIAAYVIAAMVLLFLLLWLLDLLLLPFYQYALLPLANKMASAMAPMGTIFKRGLNSFLQLPKAIGMVLVFALLLNFYTTYINNPGAASYINSSKPYQVMNNKVLVPVLHANAIQQLPVLISDSFNRAVEDFSPGNNEDGNSNYWNLPVIKYFNGMTLEEAVKSTPDIDALAKEIVGTETEDRKKAYLLYQWIAKNIKYDQDKATIIAKDSFQVNSGSIVTYTERKGICFDYACLYISMARSVDLKVRFVTGLGYGGTEWGDHAWNQVYDSASEKWLNVDTTFGSSGQNFFDPEGFSDTHKYEVIQAEW